MTLHCVNGRCGSLGTLARSPDGLGEYFGAPPWAGAYRDGALGALRRRARPRRRAGTSGCAACAGVGAYGEGCNPSAMPAPDEQVILDQIAAKQAEKLVKLSQCDLLTGPAVGGCKSGVSSGYEGEIARLRNDLAALCAAKQAGLVQTWSEDEQTVPAPGSGALDGKLPYILGGVGLLAVVGIGLYIGRKR